jgi:23S rRNA (adenine2030-N6)-methyltransferase
MLSYRHAFHAGNHADVLKHFTLMLILEYLTEKDKGLLYLDTHSGAGGYMLESHKAKITGEYKQGIQVLWNARKQGDMALPPELQRFLDLIAHFNERDQLSYYPGSPLLAAQLLRPQDRLHLYELHSTDYPLLQHCFKNDHRVRISQADGFAALKSELPPPTRRGLVLIDPSYETANDYTQVIAQVKTGIKRFAQGVYAVWYPQLNKIDSKQLPKKWSLIPANSHLMVSLQVKDGLRGMTGSSMMILNPPWKLKSQLESCLPTLVKLLGEDDSACFHIDYNEKTHFETGERK